MPNLYDIIDEYWKDYQGHKNRPEIVKDSIPIIWFGDLDGYFESKIKTITVGLNPSKHEFSPNVNYRFPNSQQLATKSSLNNNEKDVLSDDLNNYFIKKPYRKWFDCYDNKCMSYLNGLYDVGYNYKNDKHANTAIHVDCFSALATDPVWSGLDANTQKPLAATGSVLFTDFVEFLQPNVILFSTAFGTFENVITKIYPNLDAKNPDIEIKMRSYLTDGKLIIHGRYNGQPFAPISDSLKTNFFYNVARTYQWDNQNNGWIKVIP